MASGGNSIISEVLRRRSVPKYYCHECKSRFGTNGRTTNSEVLSCPGCMSEFIEVLEQEEGRTVGATILGTAATTTTGREKATSSSTPSSTDKDEIDSGSTVAMEADDPQPEAISGPRRRTSSPFRTAGIGGHSGSGGGGGGGMENPFAPFLGGDQFVYVRRRSRPPLARAIHDHIERLHERLGRERGQQQQQQGNEQGQQRSTPPPLPSRRLRTSRARDLTPDDMMDVDGSSDGSEDTFRDRGRRRQEGDDNDQQHSGLTITMDLPLLMGGFGGGGVSSSRGGGGGGGGRGSRRGRPRIQFNPFAGGTMVFGFGAPGEVHGSSADYAWGPNGLDNIISQLLANLEDNGPPPADQDKIAALPTVVPSEEQLKACSDCSVCKEDFTIGESLVLLPCTHLYHGDCIMPWLKLHDTCPTCRYSINTGKVAD